VEDDEPFPAIVPHRGDLQLDALLVLAQEEGPGFPPTGCLTRSAMLVTQAAVLDHVLGALPRDPVLRRRLRPLDADLLRPRTMWVEEVLPVLVDQVFVEHAGEHPGRLNLLVAFGLDVDEGPTVSVEVQAIARPVVLVQLQARFVPQLDRPHPHEVGDVGGREVEQRFPFRRPGIDQFAFDSALASHAASVPERV
jgi:hypothetical protein